MKIIKKEMGKNENRQILYPIFSMLFASNGLIVRAVFECDFHQQHP